MPIEPLISSAAQDLRFGFRELIRDKGFFAAATGSLALGIMAATAMYSVIHGVIVEPFPYKDVDNLYSVRVRGAEERFGRTYYSVDEYCELARRSTIFEGVAGSTISEVLWISDGEPLRLRGNHITNNGFDVMGVPALLGQTVSGAEAEPETKAVLGYRFWMRQFGGDANVLGRVLTLNGKQRTIVGVMPPRFMFRGADVYLPVLYRTGERPEGVDGLGVTARLKPGVNEARAETDLKPIIEEFAKTYPGRYPPQWRVSLLSFKETYPSGIREILWVMFGAVGLLLLMACVNVSNLLLAKATGRQKEIAVRSALGGSRGRIVRQLLTEHLLLALIGGALGMAGSWAGLKAILAVVPANVIPDEAEVALNAPVLLFSVALCLVVTILFGLAPAIYGGSIQQLAVHLKESARGSGGGGSRRMQWVRGALVTGELVLAVLLLSGAALFLHTLLRIYNAPMGVAIENRLTMRVPLNPQRYPSAERRTAFLTELNNRLQSLPGVKAAGVNTGLHPLYSWNLPVEIPGQPEDKRPVSVHQPNAEYLAATGIALRSGRFLEQADIAAKRHVAVVNERFVQRYFPESTALGRVIRFPRLAVAPASLSDPSFEIVGVVADAMLEFESGEARPEVYFPYSILGLASVLTVHTSGDPLAMSQSIRRQVYEIDSSQFVDEVRTLESTLDRFVYSRGRFNVWLMGTFGALGLALAVAGIFGLLAQIVSMRKREFAVRMAIGASFSSIVRDVLRRGIVLMAFGLGAGCAVTLLLMKRFGKTLLGANSTMDPLALAGACAVLFVAGLVASLVPAWRAGRTNPVEMLRLDS
jgi:putative ABC transport system permease protein